jgi:hypothetical protein
MKGNSIKLILVLCLVVFGYSAYAQSYTADGNPLDTPATNEVTAEAVNCEVGYEDIDDNEMPTVEVEGSDIDYTVLSEFGFSGPIDADDDRSVTPGDHVTHEAYYVTNEGNVSDSYDILSLYTYTLASNWTVEVWNNEADTLIDTLTAGTQQTNALSIADNDDISFRYEVDVSPNVAEAPDGSSITIYTTVETDSTPGGAQYAGGNNMHYGGVVTGEITNFPIDDSISSPVMSITRESIVDSPDDYQRNGGGATDPVPGAVITYTMYYQNTGSATAESVIIIDKITTVEAGAGSDSAGGKLAHVNAGPGDRGPVTLTNGGQGSASGWTAYYTTEATPVTAYGGAGWVSIGSVDSNDYPSSRFYNSINDSDPEFGAIWIKWEKASVDPSESESLVWGVSIR